MTDTFDVVTAFDVLEHVPDPRRALRELAARVRPGGFFVLTTPRFDSIAARFLRGRWHAIIPSHLVYFTAGALRDLLKEIGPRRARCARTSDRSPPTILPTDSVK